MGGRRTTEIAGATTKKKGKAEKAPPVPKEEKSKKKTVSKKSSKKGSRGKLYQAVRKKVDRKRAYPLEEAIKLVKEVSYAKFDASVEAHLNLGLDPGKSEHQIRTSLTLPHGTGRNVRVLVFARGKEGEEALKAGAEELGDEETIEKIAKEGKVAADAVVATADFMPKIAKVARFLGPQGLMPSPKSGTVTDKPSTAVAALKKGRVELRTREHPTVHTVIGRTSFPEKKLIANLEAILEELERVKPAKVKGKYLRALYLSPTMGPSIKVELASG
jgi:large subunit ribosomal protein L1